MIVGSARDDDPYYGELRALAGDDPRILFTGAVYGEELAEWYSNAFVYVLPSQMEGLPITLLEAMSLGRCCIASDIDANVEALGGKGILFPVGNPDALKNCLQEAIANPDTIRQTGEILHQHVLNHYTWTLVAEKFIHFYQKATQSVGQQGSTAIMKDNNETPAQYPVTPSSQAADNAVIPLLAAAQNQYPPPPAQIPFRQYWSVLRHHARTILLLTAATTTLLLTLAVLTNPTYTAKSSIKIETTLPKLLEYDVDTTRQPSYVDETVFYNTQYKMLRSRDLAERVINKLGIRDSLLAERTFKPAAYWLIDPPKALFTSVVGTVRGLFSGDTEQAEDAPLVTAEEIFLQNLTIKPVKNSRIIDIHYTAQDPVLARDIVQAMTEAFVGEQDRGRQESAEQAKQFLDKQMDEAREKLQASEVALVRYARDKNIVDTNSDEPVIAKNIEELSKAYMASKENRIRTQSLYSHKGNLAGVLGAEDDPVIQEHKKELGKLQGTYLANLELFKPNFPSMLSLQEQIQSRERMIAEQSARIQSNTTNNLKASYDAALTEEQKLGKEIKLLEKQLLAFRSNNIGYTSLKRDVDTSRSLYEGLLQRLKEVSVVETAQTDNVRIVDKAVTPTRKDGPAYSKYLLLGILSGLFLGAFLVLMREMMRPKVHIMKDLQDIGGQYQVLSALPYTKGLSGSSLAQTSVRKPALAWLDAMRYLRTSLALANGGRFPQVLHITSPLPGEGKSTTATNLSILLANSGHKVLLIDADLRKPTVHKHFDLDNSYGLTHYLTAATKESPLNRIKGSRLLFVVCAGPAVSDPVEALSSQRMQELLDKARGIFDYVIIDAPPVLGMADSLLLSSRADGTLLIVGNNKSSKQDVRTAIDCLEKSHGRIVGMVQNMVPKADSMNASGYSDGRTMLVHA